jgi:hypothetical protein
VTCQVVVKNGHGARLVAAMTAHGISHILTFSTREFARSPAVIALGPVVLAGIP